MTISEDDPDAPLVERIAVGDQRAVRQFVGAKLPRLLALAGRMLGDRQDAEDVAQEVFLRVWRQAPKWRSGEARFEAWVHRVTLNLCRDRLRKRRGDLAGELPDLIDPAPTADTVLDEATRGTAVAQAISMLPQRQREAILLVHYQEMSNIDAAAVLEVSVDALESLLARGRRTLRRQFIQEEGDNED